MKPFPWILTAVLSGIVAWLYFRPSPEPVALPSAQAIRDSVRVERETVRVQTTRYLTRIREIPADTLGPILRALATRPILHAGDTLLPERDQDTTCRVLLTCSEARQLVARDTVRGESLDSLRGEVRVYQARGDSLAAHLGICLGARPRWGYVAAFEAGYLAGTVVTGTICAVVR